MNPDELWKSIIDENNLKLAYNYALYDRLRADHFYDPIEIYYVRETREELLSEIRSDLTDPSSYTPQNAYSYFPPKNNLCYRRMIYLPFKDLVIRYALVTIIADQLDIDLHERCFANRREKGEARDKRLLESFAEKSWPEFALWQEKSLDQGYSVLLRTDISSFYDSISHEYLKNSIADALGIDQSADIIRLLEKHLKLDVVSYSYEDYKPKDARTIQQGLTIGNTCDAFLANVFLGPLDTKLIGIEGIQYGRYNDDIRIFSHERKKVLEALQIIQEYLLERGLNLNASKTKLAEGSEEIIQLQSKWMTASGDEVIDYVNTSRLVTEDDKQLSDLLDKSFQALQKVFNKNDAVESDKDAKAYCKYLSHRDEDEHYTLPLSERTEQHMDTLMEIMERYRSGTRHAAWLLVESGFYRGMEESVQEYARDTILRCLESDDVSLYGKYRLIHHMTKKRESASRGEFRFIEQFEESQIDRLENMLKDLIGEPAFELNIIVIFTLIILGNSFDEIYQFTDKYMGKPIGDPVKAVLNHLRDTIQPADIRHLEPVEEPDSSMGGYY